MSNQTPETAAFTVRLDKDSIAALDALATSTERSRNWLVASAIEEYVAQNQWQIARIEDGMRAANAGNFANDEAVARVFTKYGPTP
ncbi:MAG: CopG family ribbon-helix-helix protein [Rickettsiales bacterium]